MVTREQAIKLIRKYEPVLFLHPEEPQIPVHPGRFMEHSALWSAQPYRDPGGKHLRTNWQKLIRKGTITLNPQRHNRKIGDFPDEAWRMGLNPYLEREDDVIQLTDLLTYPGSSAKYLQNTQDGYLFLNCAGWTDTGVANVDITKSQTLYSTLPSLKANPYQYRYFAQVLDLKGLNAILVDIKDTMSDQSWVQSLLGFLDQKWIIWYYFSSRFMRKGVPARIPMKGTGPQLPWLLKNPLWKRKNPSILVLARGPAGIVRKT